MGVYELLWGIGAVVLLLALAWGAARYRSRNRANDKITEEATRELYTDPDHYDEKRAELERKTRPPG
jgi:hypothetical protein